MDIIFLDQIYFVTFAAILLLITVVFLTVLHIFNVRRYKKLNSFSYQIQEESEEHRKLANEFEKREAGIRNIFQTYPFPELIVRRHDWKTVQHNHAFTDLLINENDINIADFLDEDHFEKIKSILVRFGKITTLEVLTNKKIKPEWILFSAYPVDYDNESCYVVGFVDISNQKLNEWKLIASEKRFKNLFDYHSSIMIISELKTMKIIDNNKAAEEFYGYKKEEFTNMSLYDLNYFNKEKFEKEFSLDKHSYYFIMPHRLKNGEQRTVEMRSVKILNEEKKELLYTIINDIHEEIEQQRNLDDTKRRFEAIFTNSAIGMAILDSQLKIREVNKRFSDIIGYSIDELKGMSPIDFTHPDDKALTEDYLKKLKNEELCSLQTEKKYIAKDGQVKWVELNVTVYNPDNEEKYKHIIGIISDKTDMKIYENKLVSQNKLLERARLISNLYVCEYDIDNDSFVFNDEIKSVLGIDRDLEEFTLEDYIELVHPEDRNLLIQSIEEAKSSKKTVELDYRIIHRSGRIIHLRERSEVIYNSDGTPTRIICTAREVTEEIRIEEELLRSRHLYKKVVETAPFGIMMLNTDAIITFISDNTVKMLDYSDPIELLEQPAINLFVPEQREKANEFFQKRLTGLISTESEFIGLKKDGSKINIEMNTSQIKDTKGNITGILYVVRDITTRKIYEEKIIESENKYRAIFETTSNPTVIIDEDTTILLANREFSRMSEYSIEEIEGKIKWPIFVSEEDLARMIENQKKRRIDPQSAPKNYEFQFISRYGNIHDCFLAVDMIPGTKQSIASISDITEVKKTERALREREEKFRLLAENSKAVVFRINLSDEFYEYVSPASRFVFGYSPEKCYEKKLFFREILEEEYIDIFDKDWDNIKNGIVQDYYEYRIIRKDKQKRWVFCEVIIVKDELGLPVAVEGFITDITDKKQTEQELVESEEKARRFADLLPETVFEIDLDGNFTFLNQKAYKQFGYDTSDKEMIINAFDFFLPEDVQKIRKNLPNIIDSGKSQRNEYTAVRKDGSTFPVIVYSNPIYKSGKPVGLSGIVIDITQRKEAEKHMLIAKEEAERANRMKSEFLANMSHEIRTPLNAILGFGELISKNSDDTQLHNYSQSIVASGSRLLSLLNDLLDLSKIEAGRLEFHFEPINIKNMISDSLKHFSFEIKRKGVHYCSEINPDIPEYLKLDEIRMRQILHNLISNAEKFTKHGLIRLAADYEKTSEKKCNIYIELFDTGKGMNEEMISQIFDSFYQGKMGESDGTGLGLAITKRLVEKLGGRLEVDSVIDKASLFYIELYDIEISNKAKKSLSDVDIDFSNIKLLAVDDIKQNLNLISAYLKGTNIDYHTAKSGQEALELLETISPDVLLIDLFMPGLSGKDTVEKIKASGKHTGMKTIAISAMEEELLDDISIFDMFISKPLKRSTIIEILSELNEQKGAPENMEEQIDEYIQSINSNIARNILSDIDDIILKLYHDLRDALSIDIADDFADKICEIAHTHEIKPLENISKKLKSDVSSFNINEIHEHLDLFGKFYDKITSRGKDE